MTKKKSSFFALATILTIFAVIVSWYFIAPGYKEAKIEKAQLEDELLSLQEKLSWLEEAETGLKSAESVFNKLMVSVPDDDKDEANAISELEAIALKHNLAIPSISFSEPVSSIDDGFESTETPIPSSRVGISLVVEGTFDDISGFIKSVENSVKFMNIKSFTYAVGESSEVNLSLELEGYAQNIETDIF